VEHAGTRVSHENGIAVAENMLKKVPRLPDPGGCPGELIFVGPVHGRKPQMESLLPKIW
jgi:hypothetical protein